MKNIKILATGGTISAHHENRLDFRNYQSGHYSGEDILNELPEAKLAAKLSIEQVTNVSSTLIGPQDWLELRNRVYELLEKKDYDGLVITHGTNTIEETAYFLHLTVASPKPLVLTGAQRPLSALSTDAKINLHNAIQVAASDQAYQKGALVVLNNQISSARFVSKLNTYRLETFQSPEYGFLGAVDPDQEVNIYQSPTRKHTYLSDFSRVSFESLPKVGIVYSYAGADGEVIEALVKSGVKGIVIAGTGAGRCSELEEQALSKARKAGILVVMSSRYGLGRVVALEKYDDLQLITADNLPPQKARILLMLALAKYGHDIGKIQAVFNEY